MDNSRNMYTIHSGLTKEEVKKQLFLDRKLYEESANKRFSLLDSDYPLFAKDSYKYPLHGNRMLAKAVREILENNINTWKEKDTITIADLGAAGGAITAIFILHELRELGIFEKAKLILVDISKDALEATKKGQFELPLEYFREMNWGIAEELSLMKEKLAQSEIKVKKIYELGEMENQVDICLCGFTHHHLNLNDKELASKEMEKITKPGGIIGVVDERLRYDDYIAWIKNQEGRKNSRGEVIPIAIESFIEIEEHQNLFKQTNMLAQKEERFFYYFAGTKRQ